MLKKNKKLKIFLIIIAVIIIISNTEKVQFNIAKTRFRYGIIGIDEYKKYIEKNEDYILQQLKDEYGKDFIIERYASFGGSYASPFTRLLLVEGYSVQYDLPISAYFNVEFKFLRSNYVRSLLGHIGRASTIEEDIINEIYGSGDTGYSIKGASLGLNIEPTLVKGELLDVILSEDKEKILEYAKNTVGIEEFAYDVSMNIYYETEEEFKENKEKELEKAKKMVKEFEKLGVVVGTLFIEYGKSDEGIDDGNKFDTISYLTWKEGDKFIFNSDQ